MTDMPRLVDPFARAITYLRVSVTDPLTVTDPPAKTFDESIPNTSAPATITLVATRRGFMSTPTSPLSISTSTFIGEEYASPSTNPQYGLWADRSLSLRPGKF